MSLITPADVRVLVQTNKTDSQLAAIIAREEAEVIARFGAHYVDASTTVTETMSGGTHNLFVRRAFTSVSAVVEDDVTLTSSQYREWGTQGRLERLPRGASWGDVLTVTYLPVDDTAKRQAVLIELVRLTLERTAFESESVAGEYTYKALDYNAERAKQMARLGFILG